MTSDAELKTLVDNAEHVVFGSRRPAENSADIIRHLAGAELARRQQPASVPAEIVSQWHDDYGGYVMALRCERLSFAEYIANKAAAYGREQAQQLVKIGVVRYHTTGGNVGVSWYVDDKDVFPKEGEAVYIKEPPTC